MTGNIFKAQRCTAEWSIVQALGYPAQFWEHRGFGHILHTDIFLYQLLVRQNLILPCSSYKIYSY